MWDRARAAALLGDDPEPLLTALALARTAELGAWGALQFANSARRWVRVETFLQRAGGVRIDQQLKAEIKASMAEY